jgi:tetratricopeptide (TPR) repeat protein
MSLSTLLDWTSNHRDTLTWLGGGAVTVAGGAWTVFRFVVDRRGTKRAHDSETAALAQPPTTATSGRAGITASGVVHISGDTQVTVQQGSTYIAGNVTNIGLANEQIKELVEQVARRMSGESIPAEWLARQEQLAQRAGVSEAALNTIAASLGVEKVPVAQLASALLDRIERLKAVQQRADALPTDSPIKALVAEYVADGAYEGAETLLDIALKQVQAVRLIQEGQADGAIETLQLVEGKIKSAPEHDSIDYRITLGFVYKTLADAYGAQSDQATSSEFRDKAMALFEGVAQQGHPAEKNAKQVAEAILGIGNILQQRKQYREAIENYRIAVAILPTYAYAWHDLFSCYEALAQNGNVDLEAMRFALDKTAETGKGWPNLDEAYIASLRAMLARYEKPSHRVDSSY